jgi:hypothetical protein
MGGKPKYKKVSVDLSGGKLTLYAGHKTRNALHEITEQMDLYLATRLQLVMKAVYEQGLKDGRKELIDRVEDGLDEIKGRTNYLSPGRPKK